MSATFRLGAKKKYTQNDLRKLMNQQKSVSSESTAKKAKIDSPLAKYPFQNNANRSRLKSSD